MTEESPLDTSSARPGDLVADVLELAELPTSGLAPPAAEAGPASARYGVSQ